MFGEEEYYRSVARRLLDQWTLEEMLEIAELDAVDWLAEMLMTNQLPIDLIDILEDDSSDTEDSF